MFLNGDVLLEIKAHGTLMQAYSIKGIPPIKINVLL